MKWAIVIFFFVILVNVEAWRWRRPISKKCKWYQDCTCITETSVEFSHSYCEGRRSAWSRSRSTSISSMPLGDVNVSQTLKALLVNPRSANIKVINLIQDDQVHQIPREISTFSSQLEKLDLNDNSISTIHHGDIQCSPRLRWLNLSSNGLSHILPGAFEGNCSSALIDLSNNNLSRFESAVFLPVLQQMFSRSHLFGVGWIDITKNPIDCDEDPCHLAWLINGNRKMLRKPILHGAVCSNGTDFNQLDPNGLNNCTFILDLQKYTSAAVLSVDKGEGGNSHGTTLPIYLIALGVFGLICILITAYVVYLRYPKQSKPVIGSKCDVLFSSISPR